MHDCYSLQTGQCITKSINLGCVADVTLWAVDKCSGRVSCDRVRVPDDTLHQRWPCEPDFTPYLELNYRCLKGINCHFLSCHLLLERRFLLVVEDWSKIVLKLGFNKCLRSRGFLPVYSTLLVELRGIRCFLAADVINVNMHVRLQHVPVVCISHRRRHFLICYP